jgi:alpha-mannosidase
MPCGESFVRQALYGRRYFADRLGARPTTAINFDPFGHSRGLVQVLAKSGYDSYIFCRPGAEDLELPSEEFTWVGFDGSRIVGHRAFGHYLSHRGNAVGKIEQFVEHLQESSRSDRREQPEPHLLLWGIGNHGGGASREDLDAIAALREQHPELELLHSTPEAYFAARSAGSGSESPPEFAGSLNPWAPGCYTSQIRIKQGHRKLEDALWSAEKICSQAAMRGLIDYPYAELREAMKALMFTQFHDILPGSSIPAAEQASLNRIGLGLDVLSRVSARAFFACAADQTPPGGDDIPILAYNPHPYPVHGTFEVEFQPASQNRSGGFMWYDVRQETSDGTGREVPVQFEKEASSVGVDWRKRMVMQATLPPASMSRFTCSPRLLEDRPSVSREPNDDGAYVLPFAGGETRVSGRTGLVESLRLGDHELLAGDAFRAIVIRDSDDAWESRRRSFREVAGVFRLATPEETAEICGVRSGSLPPVRVIEDGPVRTVVEAVFVYNRSQLVLTYRIPRHTGEIDVEVRVLWMEKRSMLKLGVPVAAAGAVSVVGQTAFGSQPLVNNGDEAVAQRWIAATKLPGGNALSVINDGTYGCSVEGNELRISLLRSPAYSGLPVFEGEPPIPQDRFTPRIDQGERVFRFRLAAGPERERLAAVDREATAFGEVPMLLMAYPPALRRARSGDATRGDATDRDAAAGRSARGTAGPAIYLSDDSVRLAAMKRAESGDGYIIRLFEPTGTTRECTVTIPPLAIERTVKLGPHEVASYMTEGSSLVAVDLMEEPT